MFCRRKWCSKEEVNINDVTLLMYIQRLRVPTLPDKNSFARKRRSTCSFFSVHGRSSTRKIEPLSMNFTEHLFQKLIILGILYYHTFHLNQLTKLKFPPKDIISCHINLHIMLVSRHFISISYFTYPRKFFLDYNFWSHLGPSWITEIAS